MKTISLAVLLFSFLIVGCSSDPDNLAPAPEPPVQKPDLSGCTSDINVTLTWETETRNNRGFSLAFGKTAALSQRYDILDDVNTFNLSEVYSLERGQKLYAAIGAIRSNGSVYFGPTHEFVYPTCAELDELLDKDPEYPYPGNNYVSEISEYNGNTDERQVLPNQKYLGELSIKPVGDIVDLSVVSEERTEFEQSLTDYLSAPHDDVSRNISPEPGILLKQKFDQAQRANLSDLPFPEEMPEQICVEFMDKQPTKPEYSTLYKYQRIIPAVGDLTERRVVTKVLAGSKVEISDFAKYKNELTEQSFYVGENTDVDRRSNFTSYFLRKADGFVFYKRVKSFKEVDYDEDSEDEVVLRNTTYYGYCYNKGDTPNESLILKLNTEGSEESEDKENKGSEDDEDAEPELPEFNGDMLEYEAELIVKLQNQVIDSGENSIFNTLATKFVSAEQKAEMSDFEL